jgi:NitT/TauT family transport system ATP-binding protein
MTAFIEVNELNYTYADGRPVLDHISFTAQERDFVAVVGPSGIGKTTLLRLLGGLLKPTRGAIRIDGQRPQQTTRPLGLVSQKDTLLPWRTVWDNVALPLEIQGLKPAEAAGRVEQFLKLVGLADVARQYPSQLSGGMAQRVALARALVYEPEVLLLDEPFGALDALTRERMGQELLQIWQTVPVTVFMVTHSITEAVLLADKVLVLNTRPGEPATITAQIAIPLPRPRPLSVQQEAQFLACVNLVREAIR